jgi:hypothetical protein
MPMVMQTLHELPTLAILFFVQTAKSLWSILCGSVSLRNGCAAVGILWLSQRDMLMDKRPSHSKIRVIAKSAGSGEPIITLRDALLYGP